MALEPLEAPLEAAAEWSPVPTALLAILAAVAIAIAIKIGSYVVKAACFGTSALLIAVVFLLITGVNPGIDLDFLRQVNE